MPIKKLGDGYYLFGTRKIYAKILNGKLVIRVGGGYMVIEEFISTYAEKELLKLEALQSLQESQELSARDKFGNNTRSSEVNVKRTSTKEASVMTATVNTLISGTHTQRRFTAQ